MIKICVSIIHETKKKMEVNVPVDVQAVVHEIKHNVLSIKCKISVQANQSSIGHFFQSWQFFFITGSEKMVLNIRDIAQIQTVYI